MVILLKDFEEEGLAPSCDFAAELDASFCFVDAHEIEGEAADDRHVFGAVAGSVAGQVVLEGDVKQPMKALDAPMAARRLGEPFDVERGRTDVEAGIAGAAVGEFGAIDELDDGLDAAEARLPRIAALRGDPVDEARSGA